MDRQHLPITMTENNQRHLYIYIYICWSLTSDKRLVGRSYFCHNPNICGKLVSYFPLKRQINIKSL